MDKSPSSPSPSFSKAATGDPRPIFKTEAGRDVAQAIERKADAVERRWVRRFAENREAWVTARAAKITAGRHAPRQELTMPGGKKASPMQQALYEHGLWKQKLRPRIMKAKANMLSRIQSPSRNEPSRDAPSKRTSHEKQPSKVRQAFDEARRR